MMTNMRQQQQRGTAAGPTPEPTVHDEVRAPAAIERYLDAPIKGGSKRTPTVHREQLTGDGAVLVYVRSDEITARDGSSYLLHAFADDTGSECAVWASAMLDSAVRSLRAGQRVWIRYGGIVPHYSGDHRTVALWTVRPVREGAPVPATPVATLLARPLPVAPTAPLPF